MTQRVNPTVDDTASVHQTAAVIATAGGSEQGFIVPAGEDPNQTAAREPDIDETLLDAFDAAYSANSLDVTIQPGQGYMGGCWIARDTPSTITLDANKESHIWIAPDMPDGAGDGAFSNNILLGEAADLGSNFYEEAAHHIWSFTTDDTGVIDHSDGRNLDRHRILARNVQGDIINKHIETFRAGGEHIYEWTFDEPFGNRPILTATAESTSNGTPVIATIHQLDSDGTVLRLFMLDGSRVSTRVHAVARQAGTTGIE